MGCLYFRPMVDSLNTQPIIQVCKCISYIAEVTVSLEISAFYRKKNIAA